MSHRGKRKGEPGEKLQTSAWGGGGARAEQQPGDQVRLKVLEQCHWSLKNNCHQKSWWENFVFVHRKLSIP